MKKLTSLFASMVVCLSLLLGACSEEKATPDPQAEVSQPAPVGQSGVSDDVSQKDIVKVAVGSKDHTTLVAALKAADYVDVLANAGPFTVFAPTNAAFAKLPAGTVEDLVKPEKKETLRNILEYHVSVGVYKTEQFTDGQMLDQANSEKVKIGVKDGKITVNGATIIASVPAANGIIHVIDGVLLPQTK
ncbi:MAG: fasciclin domain-containing protein [Ignavibacteria bacterium]|nr:fasciclin domain-containing protein [Ignavibacteria bacterium]